MPAIRKTATKKSTVDKSLTTDNNYVSSAKLDSISDLLQTTHGITSITVCLQHGLVSDMQKTSYKFDKISEEVFKEGKNNEVVFTHRGKLIYPLRLIFARSSDKIRLKLSLYIPIKLNDTVESKKLEMRIIHVKLGTMFEVAIASLDTKVLYMLINEIIKEVKLAIVTECAEIETLEKFSTEDIML